MRSRKAPMPRLWLMTDERGGDTVAIARGMPKGSGIIFRHHATPAAERRALFGQVRRVARARGLVLLLAAAPVQARAWGADGAHHRSLRVSPKGWGVLRSVAVHNRRELVIAQRIRADLVFVSSVFPTRSHVGAKALGVARFGLLAAKYHRPVIALGGLNVSSFKKLRGMKIHGWAAIDAFKLD